MHSHRLANIFLALLLAVSLAALLSMAHLLDAPPQRSTQPTQGSALADAQAQAARAGRQERAAAQLCARTTGSAAYRWSDDDTLICTHQRTGRVAVVVATGRQP